MKQNTFTITSYSAHRSTTERTFEEAAVVAQQYAAEGNLPSTILDGHGCRWTVWMGAQPELKECPASTAGYPCDCAELSDR